MDQFSDIEKLINQGRFFEARKIAETALVESDQLRMRQLLALAMSKSGMSEPARELLEPVFRQDGSDPETAGILGSIYKRLFKKTQDNKFAALAKATYQQNFNATNSYYTGINTAAMATISGKGSEGRGVAQQVIGMLNHDSSDFWEQATLGEGYLLVRDKVKATHHYMLARKQAGKSWGMLQSVYDQLLLLNFFIAIPPELLKAFAPPTIIAFTGHMIDHPDRTSPRFPASIEKSVKEAIAGAIRTTGASIGYTSLSCGSDILFAESMAEIGGELHLFLPFNREDYLRESVGFAGHGWIERFEKLEKIYPVTYVTNEQYAGNDDLFAFVNKVILGSVVLRAAMNFTVPTLLTVLSDTDMKKKEGGTRDTLNMWPHKDHHINVNPDTYLQRSSTTAEPSRTNSPSAVAEGKHLYYVIIADLAEATPFDKAGFDEYIGKLREQLLLKPRFDIIGDQYIAAFTAPASAMGLAKSIAAFRKSFGSENLTRLSLHTVTLHDNELNLDKSSLQKSLALHSLTPTGIPSAYGWFAAATTLTSDGWSMEFAGIAGDGRYEAGDVYAVTFKK